MTQLEKLQAARNLTDLAILLGYKPAGLSYILYKLTDEEKYHSFEIPKKSGGMRTINAPSKHLKELQSRLAGLLNSCVEQVCDNSPHYWQASHGFRKGRTIVSNASKHCRKRYVFNVDIEDFFGSISFGRVRGFFLKDKNFKLQEPVATIIAQIANYENALPQGSPCSPIISNLLGNILDSRLLGLAKKTRCTYTRYADDLTFSTNLKDFPSGIAKGGHDGSWEAGDLLVKEIERCGFSLNRAKTRMALRQSRQSVTGLVVNTKPNINQNYYRNVRAMCHSLFQEGDYYRPVVKGEEQKKLYDIKPLEGMLSHIYFIKTRRDRTDEFNEEAKKRNELCGQEALTKLYKKFLFFKHFVKPTHPLIVTEGKTDTIYIKHAMKLFQDDFPCFYKDKGKGKGQDGKPVRSVRFLATSGIVETVLKEGANGTSGQVKLMSIYSKIFKKFKYVPRDHPVIILCDNDDGSKGVFGKAKEMGDKSAVSIETTSDFYYLGLNLYLVKLPEGEPASKRGIEDLFSDELLNTKLEGKPFDKKKKHKDESGYSKQIFATEVVQKNARKEDLVEFPSLLKRIEACLADYKKMRDSKSDPSSNSISEVKN